MWINREQVNKWQTYPTGYDCINQKLTILMPLAQISDKT